MNKKTQIEILERAISDAQRAMNVQESIWMQEWEAARNPFIAINEWNNNHDRRMVYIQPWLDAKAELTKLKSKE
jgi:hypothetical protein